MNDAKTEHWQSVYQNKQSNEVSWFCPHLEVSLALMKQAGLDRQSRVVDIGAGASTLVDDLLAFGVQRMAALDLSSAALAVAQQRLGSRARDVEWITGDAAHYAFQPSSFDFWHDRAVLHFLVDSEATSAYVANATRALASEGFVVIGGFASDGPEKCSGLPVARRDPNDIAELFGSEFKLLDARREVHQTPWGAPQSFAYALLQKQSRAGGKR